MRNEQSIVSCEIKLQCIKFNATLNSKGELPYSYRVVKRFHRQQYHPITFSLVKLDMREQIHSCDETIRIMRTIVQMISKSFSITLIALTVPFRIPVQSQNVASDRQ